MAIFHVGDRVRVSAQAENVPASWREQRGRVVLPGESKPALGGRRGAWEWWYPVELEGSKQRVMLQESWLERAH